MPSFYPDLHLISDFRIRLPLEMLPVPLAVLSVVATDQASLQMLLAMQKNSKGRHLDYPESLPSYVDQDRDSWVHSVAAGLSVARRDGLQRLYVVRALLSQEILKEAKLRGITKPYNVFAVWFLFVAKHQLPVDDKEYIYAMGKAMVEARALVFGQSMISQDAQAICAAIEEIEESVADKNGNRDSV